MRFLFWLALIGLVYFALRSKWKAAQRKARRDAPPASPPPSTHSAPSAQASLAGEGEQMVVCSHCAIYFPASEALRSSHGGQELVFCSQQHQQQHQQNQQNSAQ